MLDPENEQAMQVYNQVKLQAIYAGMSGTAIDLDYLALKFGMEMFGVDEDDRPECFRKVLKVWHHCLAVERLKKQKEPKK